MMMVVGILIEGRPEVAAKRIEIKDKLTITRGEVGGDNGEKKAGGFSRTSVKDTWTKPRVGGGNSWGEGSGGGEWRQLYLNNNKKK